MKEECFKSNWLYIQYTVEKQYIALLSISSPNIDHFSKFFHKHPQQEMCNKVITKDLEMS